MYLGDTRIVTKLRGAKENTTHEETYKQYFYHSDHLGSATLITDYNGDEYQRIEYTPYGETWVEKTQNTGLEYLPYKFTGKEMDEETGLYYYGARYLDPKYSRWISVDPALGEYIPAAG
ncbi:MAG: RHS repeat-associated core domain-containing protein, partial [Treponema sp.]|nr:RHS repeat-associated core domain-containing protein [Treponema sp.]